MELRFLNIRLIPPLYMVDMNLLPRAPAFSGWLLPTHSRRQQADNVHLIPPQQAVQLPTQAEDGGIWRRIVLFIILHRNNTFYWLQIPPPFTAHLCSRSAKAHGYCIRRKWAVSGEIHSVIFTPTKTQTYTPDPLYKCPANIDWNSGMRQPCALQTIH